MSEQTSKGTQRSLDAIQADIDFAREQMAPWQDMLRDLHKEFEAARETIAASETVSEKDLGRMSGESREAARRVEAAMKDLHPAMRLLCHWLPIPDDYSHGYFPAVNLTLAYQGDEEYVESLAQALVEFADRFVPTLPEGSPLAGMVFADILDHRCGEGGLSYFLHYEPVAGGRAVLSSSARYHGEPVKEGTLVEVLAHAVKVAWYDGGPQRSWGDEDGDFS